MRTGYLVFLVLLSGCGDSTGTAPGDKPAHSEKLAVIQGLNAAIALSGDDLRYEVGKALAALSQHKSDVDWSRVCATSKL